MVIENEECRKGWHIHNVDYYIKHSLATILHVSSFTSSYTKFAFSFSECSNGKNYMQHLRQMHTHSCVGEVILHMSSFCK